MSQQNYKYAQANDKVLVTSGRTTLQESHNFMRIFNCTYFYIKNKYYDKNGMVCDDTNQIEYLSNLPHTLHSHGRDHSSDEDD